MVIYEDELEHYGVKGMRWGVRRSQEELDLKAGRYREKELGKIEKKRTKTWEKYRKQYNRTTDPEKRKRLSSIQKNRASLYNIERDFVSKMTWDDISDEKRAVGKQFVKSAMITVGTLPLQMLGLPSIVSVPRPGNIRTNYRLDEVERRRQK